MTKRQSWVSTAAQRSAMHSWTLGALLDHYRTIERKNLADLANELACSVETLEWISLCRRPEGDHLDEYTQVVADRFGVDRHRFAAVVRRALVLHAMRRAGDEAVAGTVLMAARDRRNPQDGTK